MNRNSFTWLAAVVGLSTWLGVAGAGPAPEVSEPLPAKITLAPLYRQYGLVAQAQRGDTCWAYSIIGCLELELSRSRRTPTPLSAFHLVQAAAKTDQDTIDSRGSNFGRAARAIERFGVSRRDGSPAGDEGAPLSPNVPESHRRQASALGRGIQEDWIRFWRSPPGWTAQELETVKRRLAAGHPVAVGMRWPKQLTVEDRDLCLLGTCQSLDETFDGHCVTLVGYEDGAKFPGGGVFLIRNTWGPGWMKEGYGRMSYQYMRSFANDALSFTIDVASPGAAATERGAPTNATDLAVTSPTAAECRADAGVRLVDEDMGRFRKGVWRADRQVLCTPEKPGTGCALHIDVPRAGRYALSMACTKGPDYGIWQVSIDGKVVGASVDFGWPNVEPSGEIRLGDAELTAAPHVIRFECRGKSIASEGFLLGLNWVRLKPASSP